MTMSDVDDRTTTMAVTDEPRPTRRSPVRWADAYALVGVVIAMALIFCVLPATSATFPSGENFKAILGSQSVLAIVALAALIPLVCGQFDLSVGAILGVSSVFTASAMAHSGLPLLPAAVIGVGLGAGMGLANGLIITRLRVNDVVTTLGTSTILGGIVTWKTHGQSITGNISTRLTDFGIATTFGIPHIAIAAVVVALVVQYVLGHTPLGRYLYAFGSNRSAAELSGLRPDRLVVTAFLLSGALCGVAGVLQIARNGSADPQVGPGFTLGALTAAFLSAAAIKPGRYNVWGTLVAILFLAVLNSGLNLAGAQPYVNDWVNGVALIVGIALASLLGRRRVRA